MASKQQLKRIQAMVWVFIYGGLLSVVITAFLGEADAGTALVMRLVGLVLVCAGVSLIFVRARLKEDA